ncbi:hypothetical protein DCC79_10380 [bacterium]|nr:hypothetical protein [Chloroflexi bacterium CFX6]RIL09663.1 MAG: hypothetical protein DCC79_10380 [bacterium]
MYLSERGRITATLEQARAYMNMYCQVREAPLTLTIIEAAQRIEGIPELHSGSLPPPRWSSTYRR